MTQTSEIEETPGHLLLLYNALVAKFAYCNSEQLHNPEICPIVNKSGGKTLLTFEVLWEMDKKVVFMLVSLLSVQ